MYQWRCPNCGWEGQLADEVQASAVMEADKIQATHHIEHCPRCQWVVRIPIEQLRTTMVAAPVSKKPAAKKTVKKVAAKRPAAKKAAVKKKVAKKVAAKKPVAKKRPAAKKPAAKRKK